MFSLWMACHKARVVPATKKSPETTWYEIQSGLLGIALRGEQFSGDDPFRALQALRMIRNALNTPGGPAKMLRDMERADE